MRGFLMSMVSRVTRSRLGALFLLCMCSFVAVFLGGVVDGQAEVRRYRIAVILPLTGPVAALGEYVKSGVDLAYEQLPNERKALIDVQFADDEFNPVKTVTSYRELKAKGAVDAVFVLGSPPALALGPITERDGVLLIAIGASDPSIAVGKEYSFIHWVIPPVLGEVLVNEFQRRNLQRIAFVSANASGTLADRDAAVAALRNKGMGDRIVYSQDFMQGETDYRAAIAQIKAVKADAVVSILFPGALSAFAKQFRQSGAAAELVGMETFEDEGEVKAAAGALEGAWFVNASDPHSEFIATYKARFRRHPGWGVGNGYDSLNLIIEGLVSGKRDANAMRDHLRAIRDYRGAMGVYSSSGDNRFNLPAMLKRVTALGFTALHSETP